MLDPYAIVVVAVALSAWYALYRIYHLPPHPDEQPTYPLHYDDKDE